MSRKPDFPPALSLRGQIAFRQGQFAAAADWLRQAVRRNPANHQARYNLALALERTGRADESQEYMRQFKQMQQDLARFNEIVTSEIAKRPTDPALHCELGQILLRSGQSRRRDARLQSCAPDRPRLCAATPSRTTSASVGPPPRQSPVMPGHFRSNTGSGGAAFGLAASKSSPTRAATVAATWLCVTSTFSRSPRAGVLRPHHRDPDVLRASHARPVIGPVRPRAPPAMVGRHKKAPSCPCTGDPWNRSQRSARNRSALFAASR